MILSLPRKLAGVVTALALAALAIFATRPSGPEEGVAIEGRFKDLLDRQPVPTLYFLETPAEEVIAELNRLLAARPDVARYHVALWTQSTRPPGYLEREPGTNTDLHLFLGLFDAAGNAIPLIDTDSRITFELTKVGLSDALRYVAEISGRTVCRMGDTIYLVEGDGAYGPLVDGTLKPEWASVFSPKLGDDAEVKAMLKRMGYYFYQGSEVRVTAPGRVLIHNVRQRGSYDLIEYPPTWRERLSTWGDDLKFSWRQLMERLTAP